MSVKEYRITGEIRFWKLHECNCPVCIIEDHREAVGYMMVDKTVAGISKEDAMYSLSVAFDDEYNYKNRAGWEWCDRPLVVLNNEEGYMIAANAPTLF